MLRTIQITPKNREILRRKTELSVQSLRDLNLFNNALETLLRNFGEVRLMDLPLQLGMDGKVMYLQIFQGERTETTFGNCRTHRLRCRAS